MPGATESASKVYRSRGAATRRRRRRQLERARLTRRGRPVLPARSSGVTLVVLRRSSATIMNGIGDQAFTNWSGIRSQPLFVISQQPKYAQTNVTSRISVRTEYRSCRSRGRHNSHCMGTGSSSQGIGENHGFGLSPSTSMPKTTRRSRFVFDLVGFGTRVHKPIAVIAASVVVANGRFFCQLCHLLVTS